MPVISQIYPWLGVKESNIFNVVECDDCDSNIDFWPDSPQKNTWYAMKNVLNRWDHTDIVVFPQKNKGNQYHEQYDFYESLCSNLSKLPK